MVNEIPCIFQLSASTNLFSFAGIAEINTRENMPPVTQVLRMEFACVSQGRISDGL